MKTRLLLSPLVAAALLAAAVIASPAASGASTASAKPCASSGLVVWAGPEEGGGSAGHYAYRLEFTNLSGSTCTVSGYPSVSAVSLQGKRVGAVAIQGAGKKIAVTLKADQSAVATLQIANALDFPKNACKPTMAAGLRIGVPGGSGSKIAPLAFETCASTKSKTLQIGTVSSLN